MFYKKNKRHFRDTKSLNAPKGHQRHPSYIVGEEGSSYHSFGLTEDPYKGKGHKNHKLVSNPDGSKKPSYMKKQMETRNKKAYSKYQLDGWKLDPVDEDYVDKLISKHKK